MTKNIYKNPKCNKKIPPERLRYHAKFCSLKCLQTYQRANMDVDKCTEILYRNMCTATKGAIGELRVCVDLLIKKYEVFRAVTPASTCDLVACKNGKCHRVEVHVARKIIKTGEIIKTKIDFSKADIGAHVLRDRIVYEPPL